MSSNGMMLQDYVPNAINNVTERIWCAGAVIPAGKQVVLGNIRNGWREITFTMGLMQDIVGMALVPPEIVAVESIPRMSGVGGMKPRGLGFWQSEPADRPEGWPDAGAPGTGSAAMRPQRSQGSSSAFRCPPGYAWQNGQCLPIPHVAPEPASPSAPKPFGPQTFYVDTTFEMIDVNRGLWAGQINGESVAGTFAGPYVYSQQGSLVHVRGTVTRQEASGNLPVSYYGDVTVTVGQHTNLSEWLMSYVQPPYVSPSALAPSRGTIDQSAPLPPRGSQGATRMGPVWPVGIPTAHARGTAGPVWPVGIPAYQNTMMPGNVASRHAITSWGKSRAGFGAGGASEFTMKAAEELDEHLTTNGCAGCDDYKSTLRQLAFKFKAACMTDPGVSGQVNFNISTPLAMTAYGVGTDKALTLVLGAKRTYDGGPCTDDNGACLGNMPQIAQVTPVALGPLINQVVSQVNDQIKTQQATPTATQLARQEALVNALVGAATGLLTALSAALAAATPAVVTKPAAPAPAPAKSGIPWSTIAIGGLIGTTILATGAFIYTHARHA